VRPGGSGAGPWSDDYGTDWTERIAKEGANVLYPANIAALP
jgi:hypothetical protein